MTTTVLAVDDTADSRDLLSTILDRAGFAVLTAATGREALAAARDADAVLLDVSLPDLSGIEVCRLLRADPATAGTPMLLVSGYATVRDVRDGLDAGADAYLSKPYSAAQLVGQLRHVLEATRADRAAAAATAAALAGFGAGAGLRGGVRVRTRPARSA
jgi:DNA-binding response OmpR family regulator